MYIGYINFFMLGVVFLRSYKDTSWGQYIFDNFYFTFPVIFVLFFIVSLILGFIDSKLGFREEEMRNNSASNPILMEILKTTRELKEKQ